MKKLILAAALLGAAGTSSAFLGGTPAGNLPANSDISDTAIIRSVLGAAPNGGFTVDARTPGVTMSDAGILFIDKEGSHLVVVLNSSGFTAASDSLAGLGTVNGSGDIVITGDGLNQLAQNVGVAPGDLTVTRLTIKKPGLAPGFRNIVGL